MKSSQATYHLNKVFRENASGNFKALTIAVGQSPSMLEYLDNRKSTAEHPNENWARELMELFTLGKGNYTEDDIKNSARAFTGWTTSNGGFGYQTDKHDRGIKSFMGRSGEFDGWQIIDIIFEQPAAAMFIANKLWTYFAYENPEPEIVETLAQTLRAANYELRPVLRQMFTSEAFYSDRARGTQVKSPAQLVVQLCEDLNLEEAPYGLLTRATKSLGQDLFYPPNVKGWDGNREWINANTLLLRYNLPLQLAKGTNAAKAREEMQSMSMQESMQETMQVKESGVSSMKAETNAEAMKKSLETYKQQAREELRKKLAALPGGEAKAIRQKLKNATRAERRDILRQLGVAPSPGLRMDPGELFAELQFTTGRGCVDALRRRFLVTPLDPDQENLLLTALGVSSPEAPLTLAQLPMEKRHAALHLVTSLAEYQLC